MRPIKFRAWDKQEQEYVYSGMEFARRCLDLEGDENNPSHIGFSDEFEGQRFEMEQYVDSVDLWEGDIVQFSGYFNDTIETGYVHWEDNAFVISGTTKDGDFTINVLGLTYSNTSWKVVGNIHEV